MCQEVVNILDLRVDIKGQILLQSKTRGGIFSFDNLWLKFVPFLQHTSQGYVRGNNGPETHYVGPARGEVFTQNAPLEGATELLCQRQYLATLYWLHGDVPVN